jgi:hypothetical protein
MRGAEPSLNIGDEPSASDISLQLWQGAYNALKASEPSLVSKYEDILTQYMYGPSSRKDLEDCDEQERLKRMRDITDKSLKKAQSRPKIEAAAGVAVQVIDLVREQVGSLLSPYPAAALAWSGFCTLTPVSPFPSEQCPKGHLTSGQALLTSQKVLAQALFGESNYARGSRLHYPTDEVFYESCAFVTER